MNGGEKSRLRRSYDRNLGWCRLWAGVGFAVATLWFAFVVEQQVHPLLDNREGDSGVQSQSSDVASATGDNNSETADDIAMADLMVSAGLTLTMFISFGIALRFRELYREDDGNLLLTESDESKEDTR